MSQIPHTYGTGRDPEKKDSHLLPITILLLCCIAVHGLTFLYLNRKEETPASRSPTLMLEDFSDELTEEEASLEDCCGLGLQFSELSDTQQAYWSLPEGVFVELVEKTGPAYKAGLRPGDLLLQVGNIPVDDPSECLNAFQTYCGQGQLELTYYREGAQYTICVNPQP